MPTPEFTADPFARGPGRVSTGPTRPAGHDRAPSHDEAERDETDHERSALRYCVENDLI